LCDHDVGHLAEVAVEDRRHLLGGQPLGEPVNPARIGEEEGDLAPVPPA
jgi:hypothetical protein